MHLSLSTESGMFVNPQRSPASPRLLTLSLVIMLISSATTFGCWVLSASLR